MRRVRCAIYTRKSSEEGLEQDFNSLDAQREACEAFIASQKHEGWEALPARYDDGGVSGGHLDRPGLQSLMQAVADRQVDQIIVYKIDRLTRSLTDFAKLVEQLDASETSFVSVTQSFNTGTSMGRLTLNMLLSFAQFEREVTAERIRDKIAASKRKGLWMGGQVPFGYQPDGRTLKIDGTEAGTVGALFDLYLEHQTLRLVTEHAKALGLKTRKRIRSDGRVSGGTLFSRGHIHHILSNPIYAGRIRHKRDVFDGQHPAIIDPELFDQVQGILASKNAGTSGERRRRPRSPLAGKLFDETGDGLTPSHSRKNGKRLRYYISRRLVTERRKDHPTAWRLPAEPLEKQLATFVVATLKHPSASATLTSGLTVAEIYKATDGLSKPLTRARALGLIHRVDLRQGQIAITLCPKALAKLLGCTKAQIAEPALTFSAPFQMRRRGVEHKLQLGPEPGEIDTTLVQNVAKARRYLDCIISGASFAEIAKTESTTSRRITDLIALAFLAPDILDKIATGTQPVALTSDYLIKSKISPIWSEQRDQIAAL